MKTVDGNKFDPVSYTHLDVYKRQNLHARTSSKNPTGERADATALATARRTDRREYNSGLAFDAC